MNTKAMDLVSYLTAIEKVNQSNLLSHTQKQSIFLELKYELTPNMYCVTCKETRQIVEQLLEDHIDGKGKETEGKVTTKRTDSPKESAQEQLFQDSDVNSRGKGAKKRVVNKTSQKRRTA